MKLVVVTPVGPGHEKFVPRCKASVRRMAKGPFNEIHHKVVDDKEGKLGRGRARNEGMIDADWYFFLDADDVVFSKAATYLNQNYCATFGAVVLSGRVPACNVWPCSWELIREYGACGTLSMGMFVRGDVARTLKFHESMEIAEDFDFYMRLPNFIKVPHKLVNIDYPRGKGSKSDWLGECRKVIDKYQRVSDGRPLAIREAS